MTAYSANTSSNKNVFSNTLEMIGNTPMIKVSRLDTGVCDLYIKLENMNPGGSIKDRIGLMMITEAERRGELKPGDTVIEATAGNTGIGLALVAAQKGYRMVLVMPDKMSREKVDMLRAMGAEVLMTRSDVEKGHPEYYQDLGKRLAEENGWYFINQFQNQDNPKAHAETTGPEIFSQLNGQVDAIVAGCGSSGTIAGITQYIRTNNLSTEIVLADPVGSILADYVNKGEYGQAGSWLVEGIGEDFVPDISDLSLAKQAYSVSDSQAFKAAQEMLQKEGVFGGPSSGTLLHAALEYCRAQTEKKIVVTFACDTGNRYLSKAFNGGWLYDMGFEDRAFNYKKKKNGDFIFNKTRSIVGRLYERRQTIVVSPSDSLLTALKRFRDNSVSQLPVIEEGRFIGILTDKAVMQYTALSQERMNESVANVSVVDFPVVTTSNTLQEVQRTLEKESYVVVYENAKFLGLITRIDMLNYLYRLNKYGKDCEEC